MISYRKALGYAGENIVRDYYVSKGYDFLYANYTIRGGELDLIFSFGKIIIFVEVKVVNFVHDIHDYITPKKLYYLNKTIESFFLSKYGRRYALCESRLDVVFVRGSSIVEVFESVGL